MLILTWRFLKKVNLALHGDSNPAIADDCQPSLKPGIELVEHVTPVKKGRTSGGSSTDQVLSMINNKLSSIREEDPSEAFGRSIAANLRDLPNNMKFCAQNC